jgi:hypothetical protein
MLDDLLDSLDWFFYALELLPRFLFWRIRLAITRRSQL